MRKETLPLFVTRDTKYLRFSLTYTMPLMVATVEWIDQNGINTIRQQFSVEAYPKQ